MANHLCWGVNQLFLWPFSMAMNYQRVTPSHLIVLSYEAQGPWFRTAAKLAASSRAIPAQPDD